MRGPFLLIIKDVRLKNLVSVVDIELLNEIIFENCVVETLDILSTTYYHQNHFFEISFRNTKNLDFSRNFFWHFQRLRKLLFFDSTIENISGSLKGGIPSISELVFVHSFPQKIMLVDFFSPNDLFSALKSLKIERPLSNFHTISTDNIAITIIPFLEILELTYCGIEIILDHSFDSITSTLRKLNLSGNLLKTIPPALLRHFIWRASSLLVGIDLSDNPLVCQYELEFRVGFDMH